MRIFILFLSLIFIGCTTKREYFEPQILDGKVKFDGKIPSKIVDTNKFGAVLKNGTLITQNGINQNIKLNKDDLFLGEFGDKFVISNLNGDLKIIENNQTIYKQNFKSRVISAAILGDQLAAITSTNIAFLIDIKQNKIIVADRSNQSYAQDSRTARPIFTDNLVLFPMLDGMILVASPTYKEFFKSIVISSESFFNNIIYFEKIDNAIYAATASRIVLIGENITKNFTGEIKEIAFLKDKFFVFMKNGEVKILNKFLDEIDSKSYDFAIFSSVGVNENFVYAIEKNGFLIKTDGQKDEIFDFPTSINKKTFVGKDMFYYNDKFFKFQ